MAALTSQISENFESTSNPRFVTLSSESTTLILPQSSEHTVIVVEPFTWSAVAWTICEAIIAWAAGKALERALASRGDDPGALAGLIEQALKELQYEQDVRDAKSHASAARTFLATYLTSHSRADLDRAKDHAIFGCSKLREIGFKAIAAYAVVFPVYLCCQQELCIATKDPNEKENLRRECEIGERVMNDWADQHWVMSERRFYNGFGKYDIQTQTVQGGRKRTTFYGYCDSGEFKAVTAGDEDEGPTDVNARIQMAKNELQAAFLRDFRAKEYLPKAAAIRDQWKKMREALPGWNMSHG